MTETKRDVGDVILKIVITVVVPITLAVVGIYGEKIIGEYNSYEQQLERMGRSAEAETSFRRQMFASLFTDFVDQISDTDDPVKLDALTTRLELLARNFASFLNFQPLFHQLKRKILEIHAEDSVINRGTTLESQNDYIKRLEIAARSVLNEQLQQIDPYGVRIDIRVPLNFFDGIHTEYKWPRQSILDQLGDSDITNNKEIYKQLNEQMSFIEFEGFRYQIEISVAEPDLSLKQVGVRLFIREEEYRMNRNSTFILHSFAFPLENFTNLERDHRAAVTLQHFDDKSLTIGLHVFPDIRKRSLRKDQYGFFN